jgi:uncharacterized membrane protein
MAKHASKKSNNGQTTAIISYITIIGTIVAIIMNQNDKDKFARFHIRQALLLNLAGIVLSWIPVINVFAGIAWLICMVIGIVKASSGEEYEMPVIGSYAQEWFKGL